MTNPTSSAALTATREEALRRLAEAVPQAIAPGHDLAGLSPFLRHRLLTEAEVAEAVIAQHGATQVETFLENLLTRTYWKGWMEARPQVYLAYRRALADDQRRFKGTGGYTAALEGRTGISAFDDWNAQLISTGSLSHSERMWYASIWIFTLRLPWTLGADHFEQHLLDGDPAINTLSWRSVGGLHTPGKHYLAKAADIEKGSAGKYNLKGRLNESAVSLTGPALPPARLMPLPQAPSALLGDSYALLVTPDDLTPELCGAVTNLKPGLVVICGLPNLDRNHHLGEAASTFVQAACADTATRLQAVFGCPVVSLPEGASPGAQLGKMLTEKGLPHLLYLQPTTGPWQDLVAGLTSRDVGLKYFPLRRSWDAQLFPLADSGPAPFLKKAQALVIKAKGHL